MIYTLYIFDPNGCCIFYKEWARKRHLKMAKEEEFKLMYGLIASIKSFVSRISPTEMKDGFQSYATDKYRLHFFESPTSLKFVMMSDLAAVSLKELLNSIYVAYVETVCRNVLVPARGRMIDSQFFIARLEFVVSQSPYFTSKAQS
ncbi:trafficking protein particle complex subunit 1-like [Paramacrobiotus metropolitanus]|uniref:trafficking protein particle complex subunit 1-like n=1 Tax=Paramacrobiotus metropolitanus TaxID=2943436 RepID=UPI002445DCB4|nr:trafficking protein particle complex subunit 1-like [Paramacrobiotus metropolitanus]